MKWTGIYVSLPVAAIDQDKAVRKSAVGQQDLVELVVHYLPRHLQINKHYKASCSPSFSQPSI